MLSWLIVLCLLATALCPAVPPVVVAARSAAEGVPHRAAPAACTKGHGRRENAGLPEAPEQRGYAQVAGCAGCDRPMACVDCGDGAGFDGSNG